MIKGSAYATGQPIPGLERAGPYLYSPCLPEYRREIDALWATIIANPWDGAPRGVTADWYDEHDDPDTATALRRWRHGWDDLKTMRGSEAYMHGLLLRAGVPYHLGKIDYRTGSFWIGELTQFYQAIREGLFLTRPIQRVGLTDLSERFAILTDSQRDLRGWNRWEADPAEFRDGGMGESFSRQLGTSHRMRFETLNKLTSVMSAVAVDLGRRASGLPDAGMLIDPAGDTLMDCIGPTGSLPTSR